MARKSDNVCRAPVRTGSAMLLVLLAAAIAFAIGVAFLAGSTTVTGVAQTMDHHAQARQIAESGLNMVVSYVRQTPNWRSIRSSGVWVDEFSLYGGIVSVTGEFATGLGGGAIAVDDPSFEEQTGQLPNPLFSPPMSGQIGGWQVARTAALVTGPTVPRIGVIASASATDGSNLAFITFPLSVNGTAKFSQVLLATLSPNTVYSLKADIGKAGLAAVQANQGFRLLAGATVVASSSDASLLTIVDLDGDFAEHTLQFTTDDAPPPGSLSIELYAQSLVGLMSGVAFDHVRLEAHPDDPLILTVVGRHGQASHTIAATVEDSSEVRIMQWTEP